ncbi:MAG: SpoIIE family protein phosphatase [Phycisphaerales bacterium]|nr:SpoIIE family protein phosphatase [Phycisphaerales bacterium]
MISLIVHRPDGRTHKVELSAKPMKFGRADTCDVVLADDHEVSREHAEIWVDARGHVLVRDRNSKNGTRVDDGEIFKGDIRTAARAIRIGEHEIRILVPDAVGRGPRFDDTIDPGGNTQFFPSTRKLDLNQQRLASLIQLTERIGGVFERKQLLEQALAACCDNLEFERALIALKTPRGQAEMPVTRNIQIDETTGTYKVSRTLINRALIQGERAIVNNPATDLVGNLTESLVRFPICSALCVPILYQGEILGVIYGDRITQAATYQPDDVDYLAAIAQQVGVGLANLRLFEEYLRSQKVSAALEQARKIQQQLLPGKPLSLAGITLEGVNEPSSEVSGDYFDYFEVDDHRIGLIIADVTGHGLPAALLMANLQSAVRVALTTESSLPTLAARINRLICQNTQSDVFITGIIGILDAQARRLDYVSAGHPAPIVLTPGAADPRSEHNSLPFGIVEEETYEVQSVAIDGPTSFLLYTDGLVEAADTEDRMLGLDPILARLRQSKDFSTGSILRATRGVLREFLDGIPKADDMTLLAIQVAS